MSLWNPIPTPSITASSTAQPIAEFRAAFTPPRTARLPPVKKPAMTVKTTHECISGFRVVAIGRSHLHWRLDEAGHGLLALYGSSFLRIPLTAQSNVEKRPPQTPKLPPSTGARAFMAVRAPMRRSPYGELRKPLIPCQREPPIACERDVLVEWNGFREEAFRGREGECLRPCKRHRQNRIGQPRGRDRECDPLCEDCVVLKGGCL